MCIYVYYPKTETGWKKLQKDITQIHTETVIDIIKKMQLSESDTKKLIDIIHDKTLNNSNMYQIT